MDHLCRVIVTAGVSLPTFFPGILLIFIFYYVLGVAPAPLGRSETILVLDGSQCDENGTYAAGTMVLNPEGSIHSGWSRDGCVILIQWERPVRILE